MPNKMLIDASHPEETRVVVVHGNRIEEFDFESQDKKQLKGNIYLARVTRVEPSLQAAFVEYGGNRHGFLAFSEIHPDYYQIPVADRQALLKAEAEAAADEAEEEENEERGRGRRRRRSRGRGRNGDDATAEAGTEGREREGDAGEDGSPVAEAAEDAAPSSGTEDPSSDEIASEGGVIAAAVDADVVSEPYGDSPADADVAAAAEEAGDNGGSSEEGTGDEGEIESLGAGDAIEEAQARRRPVRRQYKIQEVIKRRQILLVQVVKEERGNKGAALTTYLSLAGRYSVLMPNTARGGGISRKITNAQDRKRLKEVVQDLEVPQGMGVILRTAGESRTKAEIKRDYEYLMRLWENVRTLTLQSTAPALVYEEGSLIKRSVRDLYNKDIDEILVAGEDGYREAKDFMRMLMPSHAKVVQPYRESAPLFVKHGVEAQLDRMLQPQVTLKSGGYIIINQTEALVAVDVNSGRSTREHSIEETALHTNLEAAEEVARQLRLRDLAGLIVIDFIDMEESRNNRTVEKRLKDHLKHDRARIQLGRISHFGLMEMSRQRIRASVLESTTKPCPHCGGTGHVRSDSSVALFVVRAIEEFLLKDNRSHISVRTPATTAMYVLNHKRSSLTEMEARFGVTITVEADETVGAQHCAIVRGAAVEKPIVPAPHAAILPPEPDDDPEIPTEVEDEEENDEAPVAEARPQDGERNGRRRRRRRKRGGRDRERNGHGDAATTSDHDEAAASDGEHGDEEDGDDEPAIAAEAPEAHAADDRKKRRRGRRGGKRHRAEGDAASDEAVAAAEDDGASPDEDEAAPEAAAEEAGSIEIPLPEAVTMPAETAEVTATAEPEPAEPKKGRRTATRKKAAAASTDDTTTSEDKPRKRPSRRKAAAEPAEATSVEAEATAEQPAEIVAPAPAEPAPEPTAEAAEPIVTTQAAETERAASSGDEPAEEAASETGPETTTESEAAPPPAEPDRPKKSGWWQRRGFF